MWLELTESKQGTAWEKIDLLECYPYPLDRSGVADFFFETLPKFHHVWPLLSPVVV